MTTPSARLAHGYLEREWQPIPVPSRSKVPVNDGWPQWRLSADDIDLAFNDSQNIGILLGDPSNGLTDIDLDDPMSLRLAPSFLPPTHAKFGRRSKPAAHWLYRCLPEPARTRKFQMRSEHGGATFVEIRSNGCQTIFPGSVHPSGELIVWEQDGEPDPVTADTLLASARRLAAASLLARSWPSGARHDAALALAGGLLRGWPTSSVAAFVKAISEAAGDDEVEDRVRAVLDTAERLARGEQATGWPALSEIIGERVVHQVMTWLGGPAPRGVSEDASAGPADDDRREHGADSRGRERRHEYSGNELVAAAAQEAPFEYLPFLGLLAYLVIGWSHLLAGYPRCGKTELLVRLVCEWLALGKRVLFITEESEAVWRARLSRLGGDWTGLQVYFGLGVEPDLLLERVTQGAEDIVVLDALRNLLRFTDENDNSEIARRLNPWILAAREGQRTFICAHHQRKGAGEHGEGISGGHALLGSFDIGLELLWTNSAQPRRRTVRAFSRVISPDEFVYEMDEHGTFRVLGDPAAVTFDAVKERVMAAMTADRQTTKVIHEGLTEPQPSLEQIRLALLALATDGVVRRDPPLSDTKTQGRVQVWWVE